MVPKAKLSSKKKKESKSLKYYKTWDKKIYNVVVCERCATDKNARELWASFYITVLIHQPQQGYFGFRTAGSDIIFSYFLTTKNNAKKPWEQNKEIINKWYAVLQHIILAALPYIHVTKLSENVHNICVMEWLKTCRWVSSRKWERKYKQKEIHHVT